MLFGVESGVDSILARFNKETSAEQNAVARFHVRERLHRG
ncbi:hypothetical protein SUDANB180_06888 [Streptomyces sp. enrichment culture]